jgi:ankyrin repeat protein
LAFAACKGNLNLLKALLRLRKVEIEPLDNDGQTPLMLAIQSENPDPKIVTLLLGTDQVDVWHQSTTSGKSALTMALGAKKRSDKNCIIFDLVGAYGRDQHEKQRSGS